MGNPSDHQPDPKILALALEGQQEAWIAIVSQLSETVTFSVRGWLYPQYLQYVEDMTQEVFLKVFRRLPAFDATRGSQFSTWVLTVARNHCLDFRRAQKRKIVAAGVPESIAARCPDPSEAAFHSEAVSRVESALTELAADQRAAFELHYLDGLQYQDISRRTGVAANLVKSRATHARSKLRRRLRSLDPCTAA